ncbi:MAG: 1-(5-phosphoribosyl)-5-[(5-phosphoribosylamino)methylideneamino]imidazole-4-carboxamide isomerase [Proteobacteria bacterium]|nr:1-(5-phosphoribosyl)-5-[(5-phosphoribosylamino)methylideneamino]imidazole-4-carboxamide isomerase [Pseudomonadota bacterium]
MRLIPAIDLKEGRCVRLFQGDFDAETRYAVDPLALAGHYRDLGADWLHVVDLDGARDGIAGNGELIARMAALAGLKLQVGGGLRDARSVQALLAAGVSRVVIGSAAVTHPQEVSQWIRDAGPERLTLAFDVRFDAAGLPRLATHGWRSQSAVSLWEAVATFETAGLTHVLCTDVSRDGALNGPNLDLYEAAVKRFANIHWQASGGIRDIADLTALQSLGLAAAISGKALLEQRLPREELRPFLPNA